MTLPPARTVATMLVIMGATLRGVSGAQLEPSPFRRDTVQAILVGRTETAQVAVDYVTGARSLAAAWDSGGVPITPGRGVPAYLQTTLPIHFGTTTLPAGRFRLWSALDGGRPVLIATRVHVKGDTAYAAADEAARTPLDVQELSRPANGLYIQIKVERQGRDTVGMIDQSTRGMTRTAIVIQPASTATLLIYLGTRLMSVAIGAR